MGLIENWDRTRLIVQSCGAPLVADAMAAGQVVVRSHFIETRNGALELERILRGEVERVGITIGGSEQLDDILVQPVDQGDRKSVVEGKSESVRVDLGGRLIIKKKQNYNI